MILTYKFGIADSLQHTGTGNDETELRMVTGIGADNRGELRQFEAWFVSHFGREHYNGAFPKQEDRIQLKRVQEIYRLAHP